MKIMYDQDVRRAVLEPKRIAIIGYGSQGHAHALNLRDSGFDVIVGLREASKSRDAAAAEGLTVYAVDEAVAQADVVMILAPDEIQPSLYAEQIGPNLRDGAYLAFAHGFCVHFGKIVPPDNVNVFLVAPKGPGHLVRRQYAAGSGVPCLIGIQQDPSGDTKDIALAYASGIGGGRAGILETSFREETETDLFGEQAVLCGGLSALIRAGFETLVEAGYAPQMAYFECLHEVKLITDLIYERGITGMRESISNTAEYGDLSRGERVITDQTRAAMKQILAEIQSGKFADEWMAECAAGKPNMTAKARQQSTHAIEEVGAQLREKMPCLVQAAAAKQNESGPQGDPNAEESCCAGGARSSNRSSRAADAQRSHLPVDTTGCEWPGFEAPPCWFVKQQTR